jgi:hypothetical protein
MRITCRSAGSRIFSNGRVLRFRGPHNRKEFLKDYTQILLADASGGYNGVVAGNAITLAGYWSHAKRKFVEAEKSAPEIAREAVALLNAVFAVERQAKDISVAERRELPQKQSVPMLAELHRKLLIWKVQLLPKRPMAEAVNYTLSQWEALNVFTTDGAVPIDNNVSEREMKRVVLNRKNSLFVGTPARRAECSDPGQLDQQLSSAQCRPATLFHATAGEPFFVAGK